MRFIYAITLLLVSVNAFAGNPYADKNGINTKYSYRDLTNMVMTDYKATEFNDSIIEGTCFFQDGVVDRHIFPSAICGVVFRRCNLDNVFIPAGNTVIMTGDNACCARKIMIQNDLSDWILNNDLTPKEPMDKEEREKLGISCDPKDIPIKKQSEYIVDKKRRELVEEIK